MRTWLAAALIGCVLTLVACSPPTNNVAVAGTPSPSPTPSAFMPAVGDCFSVRGSDLTESEKVPCTTHHFAEEAFIGSFTGDAAAVGIPPVANSIAMRQAYEQCAAPTQRYLGGDWHSALMQLELEIPDVVAWRAGARWFRCELSASPIDHGAKVGADVSFRGILAGPTPLSVRCITWKGTGNSVHDFEPVSCSSPHNGEFVGAYTAPARAWPATVKQQQDIAEHGCENLVAQFVGFPSWQALDNPYVGYLEFGFDETQWNMGDRSARCYVAAYTKDGKFVGSVKGIRSRTPKG